jgi:hypothetical protein
MATHVYLYLTIFSPPFDLTCPYNPVTFAVMFLCFPWPRVGYRSITQSGGLGRREKRRDELMTKDQVVT